LETDETDGINRPPDPRHRHRDQHHALWLYRVFSLSLRDVEFLLAERGIVASYETIRRWCKKFGQTFCRPSAPPPAPARRHMVSRHEVFIRIQGVQHYLCHG
jgi:putative transposase